MGCKDGLITYQKDYWRCFVRVEGCRKWSSARSVLYPVLACVFINELDGRKENMVIKFSDGINLGGIVSMGGQDLNSE